MQSEGAEGEGGGEGKQKGAGARQWRECMVAWAGMATTSAANFGH